MNSSKNQNDLSMGLNDQISFLEPKSTLTPRGVEEKKEGEYIKNYYKKP